MVGVSEVRSTESTVRSVISVGEEGADDVGVGLSESSNFPGICVGFSEAL